MKYLRIAFGIVVMLALMAVAASPAMAIRWEQCKKVTPKTGKFTEALCKTSSPEGEWERQEITQTEEVTSSGELELTDTKAPGGASTIVCKEKDEGWIGVIGGDGEAKITVTNCTRVSGACETEVTVRSVNLPWFTRLEEVGGKIRDAIRAGAGKSPGYVVECKVGGIFILTDECVGPISRGMENLASGDVQGSYDKISEEEKTNSTCKLGGAESSLIRGFLLIQQKKNVGTYIR